MALTLITPPPSVAFSKDKIFARFYAPDAVANEGAYAVNRLNVSSNTAPGVMFHFYYGTPFVMISAAVPDASGNQFPAGSGTPVAASILIPYFRANPRLNNDFVISEDAGDVLFTAKIKGPFFNCVPDTADVTNTVAGASEDKEANYTILFNLYLENKENTGYDLIYRTNLALLPKSGYQAQAIIGDKLAVSISESIRKLLPEQPSAEVIQCTNSCRRYFFEYAESYGDPVEQKPFVKSEIYTILDGGLSAVAKSKTNLLDLISPNTPENDCFLRQGSKIVKTRSNQPQYLFFFNTRESRTADIVFDFTFYGDEEEIHTEVIEGVDLAEKRKYAFNARFDQVYLDPVEGKKVKFYEVYLKEGEDRISEKLTYYLDYSLQYYVRYFLNWSSFGSLDSRCTTGRGQSRLQLTNETADRISQPGESIQFGQAMTFNSKIKRNARIATGFLRRDEVAFMTDFYLSNLKYRQSEAGLLPITVKSATIDEIIDGENLMAHTLDYDYLFSDHAYTDGDAEDAGMSIGIFGHGINFFGLGSEIDPTVPQWVKDITEEDIERWNTNGSAEPLPAPAGAQTGGFFTVPWDTDKKEKYGDYGKFVIELSGKYVQIPITITYGGDGKPSAYIFELSGIDALIHIIT